MAAQAHIRLLFCLLILISVINSIGQSTNLFFDQYSTSDGLSNNLVQCITQDRSGYIWIGTEEGLNRFDGNSFRKYYHHQGDSTGIPGNDVEALCAESDYLWIGLFGQGVSRFNYSDGSFKNYVLPSAGYSERSSNSIRQIVSLNGQIFVTSNSGFYFYNKELDDFVLIDSQWIGDDDFPYQLRLNVIPDQDRQGLWIQMRQIWFLKLPEKVLYHQGNNPNKWEIFDDTTMTIPGMSPQGKYWYQSRYSYELNCFDVSNGQKSSLANPIWMNVKGSEDLINAVFPDDRGGAWIARDRHSNYYLTSEGVADSVVFHYNYPGSIGDCVIRSFFTDKSGSQWIGTNNGVFREIKRHGNLRCFGLKHEISKVQEIKTSLWDSEYFYYVESDELKRIETRTGKSEAFTFAASTGNLIPENIAPFDKDHLLVYMSNSDFWLFNKKSTQLHDFYCASENVIRENSAGIMKAALFSTYLDDKGYLWIAEVGSSMIRENLASGELTFYGEEEEGTLHLPSDHINAMTVTPHEKDIVLGFIAGFGVWKWNVANQQFEDWIKGEAADIVKSTTINTLQFDKSGKLWIGLNGTGILIWNPLDGSYQRITREQGLPGEYINRIAMVGNESALVITNNGACRVHTSQLRVENILVDFGTSRAGQMISTLVENYQEDQVWFTFHNYVFRTVFSEQYGIFDVSRPSISAFYVFGKEIFPGTIPQRIELNYDQNFFTIDLTSFYYGKSGEVELSYMLEGYDRDWNLVNSLGQAAYTSVPGGHYNLKIRSRKMDGEWGIPQVYSIHIIPPFWERWWFYGLVVMFIGAIIYGVYKYRLSQILKLQAVRNKIAHDLHDDVGATLSSINIYSKLALDNIQKNPDDSKLLLGRINRSASSMMDNMSDIVWSINPRNDTLKSLVMRIKAHSSEILGSMNIHVKFDQQIADDRQLNMQARKNLFLIAKEAVNNIAKHSAAKEVKLYFATVGGNLEMIIADNGSGELSESAKGGNGMISMKKRAEELGGTFAVESKLGEGTTLLVKIPITNIRH
jgi:ligand-binding sensor domain-containing protein